MLFNWKIDHKYIKYLIHFLSLYFKGLIAKRRQNLGKLKKKSFRANSFQ